MRIESAHTLVDVPDLRHAQPVRTDAMSHPAEPEARFQLLRSLRGVDVVQQLHVRSFRAGYSIPGI